MRRIGDDDRPPKEGIGEWLLFATDCGWWTYGKEKKPAPQFGLMKKLRLREEVARKVDRGNAGRLFGFGGDVRELPPKEPGR